jgi:hypothetical protein
MELKGGGEEKPKIKHNFFSKLYNLNYIIQIFEKVF